MKSKTVFFDYTYIRYWEQKHLYMSLFLDLKNVEIEEGINSILLLY